MKIGNRKANTKHRGKHTQKVGLKNDAADYDIDSGKGGRGLFRCGFIHERLLRG